MYIVIGTIILGLLALLALLIKDSFLKPAAVIGRRQAVVPEVTLVFFTKNNENTIEWLVRRLMMLTYGNYAPFEIILVDRGSTDKTLEIAAMLQRDYPSVQLINGIGSMISVQSFMGASIEKVIFMEELSEQEDHNLVIEKMRTLLKKRWESSWDHGPIKIETREEYNINRHNDTIK